MLNSVPKPPHLKLQLRVEEVLEARYGQLRRWAGMLTRGDLDKAEDVVHDLYVSMSLTKPDLSRVENLDNYLYKCLRHIYLSQLSQSSREALQSVTAADFDSIQLALWARNNGDLLQQQNDLRHICNYVVWRKAHFKGASYFILRFYHGYHLNEIAKLAGLTLAAIQAKLSQTRSEVQLYMQAPDRPQLKSGRNAMPEPSLLWNAVSSPDLFQELRKMILDARDGECLPEDELLAHYISSDRITISSSLLSHIVSCERCLSLIDRHFHRPTLKDREPLFRSSMGNSEGKKSSHQKIDSGQKALQQSVQRQCEEIYQHRPGRLSIAVDGKIIASHDVRARQSMLSARIERPENANFVEVFSEQHLRIAFIPLEQLPPEGPHEQIQRVSLSDGRWMTLVLTFDGMGLNSEVTYFDPALNSEAPGNINDNAVVLVRKQAPVEEDTGTENTSPSGTVEGNIKPFPGAKSRLIDYLTKLSSRLSSNLTRIPLPDMNPIFATAMVLAVASVLCFALWLHQSSHITAKTLLGRAEVWDSTAHKQVAPGVIHQKVRITTARRTMDRDIYRDAQGTRTPRKEALAAEDQQLKDRLALAGVNWNEPLSATGYQDWHDRQRESQDLVARAGTHLLKLTTVIPNGGAVAQESLTVRDTDFHPVERTIELRDADTIEIAELNYEVMPWGPDTNEWFEPTVLSSGEISRTRQPFLPSLPVRLTEAQLDYAELSARLALNQLHADNGERIEIVRTPSGIQVKGIVETDGRKRELETQLRLIAHVIPSIFSYSDMERQRNADSDISSIRASSVTSQSTPLEDYLIGKGWSRDRLRELSYHLFDSSVTVYRESTAIAALMQQYSSKSQLSPENSLILGELVASHKFRLTSALQEEERGIAETNLSESVAKSNNSSNLMTDARQNADLIKELVSASNTESRPAQSIVPELLDSITQLRTVVSHLPENPRGSANSSVSRQAHSEQH
jgi:DNA-directed RNA polymerase specialized sigma24 family protein